MSLFSRFFGYQKLKDWPLPSFDKCWDKELEIESSAHQGKTHKFNLFRKKCSCMEKYQHQIGKKICSHQARYIIQNLGDFNISGIELSVLTNIAEGYSNSHYRIGKTKDGVSFILGYGCGDWINIFIAKNPNASHSHLSYSIDEARWAYGTMPPSHEEIENIIHRELAQNRHSDETNASTIEIDITATTETQTTKTKDSGDRTDWCQLYQDMLVKPNSFDASAFINQKDNSFRFPKYHSPKHSLVKIKDVTDYAACYWTKREQENNNYGFDDFEQLFTEPDIEIDELLYILPRINTSAIPEPFLKKANADIEIIIDQLYNKNNNIPYSSSDFEYYDSLLKLEYIKENQPSKAIEAMENANAFIEYLCNTYVDDIQKQIDTIRPYAKYIPYIWETVALNNERIPPLQNLLNNIFQKRSWEDLLQEG